MTEKSRLKLLCEIAINRMYAPIRWKKISDHCYAFLAQAKNREKGLGPVCEIMCIEADNSLSILRIDDERASEIWLAISHTKH